MKKKSLAAFTLIISMILCPFIAYAADWEVFENTNLKGSVSGTVQKGRAFVTTSGNVYEVTENTFQLVLEIQPEVTVLKDGDTYKLVVEGFDEPVICKKLN